MRRRASTITTTITTATTLMANIDIARLPAPSMASFELQSSLLHPHPLAVSHALSAIETCALLFDVYDLAWKTLCHIHASSSMARRSQLDSAMQDEGCQRGPPQPDPEPAAPPIIILAQSGNPPAAQPRRAVQEPRPAQPGLAPRQPTSSLSHQRSSRYNLRSRSTKPSPSLSSLSSSSPSSRPPNKPRPAPEPHPAPPVIILSADDQQPAAPRHPIAPTSPPTSQGTPRTPSNPDTTTMGSKVSKVRERSADGKLQPSQERLDKEEMKEPSNYYTSRSKSMRRKATKGEAVGGPGGSGGGL